MPETRCKRIPPAFRDLTKVALAERRSENGDSTLLATSPLSAKNLVNTQKEREAKIVKGPGLKENEPQQKKLVVKLDDSEPCGSLSSKQSTISAFCQTSVCSSAYSLTEAVVRDRLSAGINIAMNCVRGMTMLEDDELLVLRMKYGLHELKAYGRPDVDGNVHFCIYRTWPFSEGSSAELHAAIVSEMRSSLGSQDVGSALLDAATLAEGFNSTLSLVTEDGLLADSVLDITAWPLTMPCPDRSDEMIPTSSKYLLALLQPQSSSLQNTVAPETEMRCEKHDGLVTGAGHVSQNNPALLEPPRAPLSTTDICVEISTGSGFQTMVGMLGQLVEIIITVGSDTVVVPAYPDLHTSGLYDFNFHKVMAFAGTTECRFTAVYLRYTHHHTEQVSTHASAVVDARSAMDGFTGEVGMHGLHGQLAGILNVALWIDGTKRPTALPIINPSLDYIISLHPDEALEDTNIVHTRSMCHNLCRCIKRIKSSLWRMIL